MSREQEWLLEEKYNGTPSTQYDKDVALLESGTPLAYLIGTIPFLNVTIHLDSHPLIPRSETEFWVERAIVEIKNTSSPSVLDLCAGSGCVGVAILHDVHDASVDFVEIDPTHQTTILQNVTDNNIAMSRTQIYTGDLWAPLPPSKKYHYIVSNPPYIDPDVDRSTDEVRTHEPHQALYGGADGFDIIKRIVEEAPKRLHAHGQLWIEHEPEQSLLIKKVGNKNNFDVVTMADQYGVERYSRLMLP